MGNQYIHIRHATASVAFFFALSAPVVGLASGDEIDQLKRENAQMKEMLMQMQQQLENLTIKTNAMEAQDKAAASEKSGNVKAKKEDIAIATTGGGIRVKSSNGNQFKIGGRLMFDHDSYDSFWNKCRPPSPCHHHRSGSAEENEIRRSRLTISGNSAKNWAYKFTIDIDHEEEGASVDTGWLEYSESGVAVRAGKFKRPGMLEERTSSKWISTIERSIINELADATIGKPDFGGISLSYRTKGDLPMSAEVGVYDNEVEDDDHSDVYGIGGRFSISPKMGDNSFAHFGVSGYSVDYEGAKFLMRSRMGVHTVTRPFGTGNMSTDDVTQWGLELAYVSGPFSLQGEYMDVESDGTNNGACAERPHDDNKDNTCDIEMDGFYLQAAYTLTGEARGYKSGSGAFAAIKPKTKGGAWELVARYEDAEVDVDARGLNSELTRTVLGANWYVNNNVKFMLNYIDAEMDKCYGNVITVGPKQGNPHIHKACGNGTNKDDGNAISLRGQYVF